MYIYRQHDFRNHSKAQKERGMKCETSETENSFKKKKAFKDKH